MNGGVWDRWQSVRRWVADERGAAVVEFAIIVPILLVLVMGIIDFGRMMAVAASLAAVTRDGARQLATSSSPTDATQQSAVETRMINAFQPVGGPALTTTQVQFPAFDGQNVVVLVTGYTYVPITPIARMVGMGTVTFTRRAVFRWERAQ